MSILSFILAILMSIGAFFTYQFGTKQPEPENIQSEIASPIDNKEMFNSLLIDAVIKNENIIDVFDFGMTEHDAAELLQQFQYEHPEYAYTYEGCTMELYSPSSIYVNSIRVPQKRMETGKGIADQIDTWVNDIVKQAPSDMNDKQKALWINQYMIDHFQYDNSLQHKTVYDMMIYGEGVCCGYTQVFVCLARAIGLDASFAISDTLNHAWNIVKIDNVWYNIDVTWNDGGENAKQYLFLSDEDMALAHNSTTEEISYQLYQCQDSMICK